MTAPVKRFSVALSFAGEHRALVGTLANLLASAIGRDRILYDEFLEAELARPNSDTYLQRLYHDESDLIVVFLSKDYERKEWPGVEWHPIRDLIKRKQDQSVMYMRLDDSPVAGVFSTDIYINATQREPSDLVTLILTRLRMIRSSGSQINLESLKLFDGRIERSALFQPFKDFASRRDIVFAVGGLGSGLSTFLFQFGEFLEANQDQRYSSADFDSTIYDRIKESRTVQREAARKLDYVRVTDHDQFDLKCLLATLAYMAYSSLHQRFSLELTRLLPELCASDPVRFANYYFETSDTMLKADLGPIVAYFFTTVQRLAEATRTDRLIVFMPWSRLAECFASHSKLAGDLWDALAALAVNQQRSRQRTDEAADLDNYDRVCLIVAGPEVPFSARKEMLVKRSVWPMPPLSETEIGRLLGKISKSFDDPELASLVREWTGGSPWYARLALSCVQHLFEANGDSGNPKVLVEDACRSAECILGEEERMRMARVHPDLRTFFGYMDRVREALGDGQSTDSRIEDAWAGPEYKRERGLEHVSPRVDAFIASGLTWLGPFSGDSTSPEDLFRRYPTLYFQKAGRLQLAAYRSITGRALRLAEQ